MRESLSAGDSPVGDGISSIIRETASDLDTPLDMVASKVSKKAAVAAEE